MLAPESSKAQFLFSQWSADGSWEAGQGTRTCSLVCSIECLSKSQRDSHVSGYWMPFEGLRSELRGPRVGRIRLS